jgi:hypothetical protein
MIRAARVLTLICGGANIVPDHEAGGAGYSVTADPLECAGEWIRRGKWRSDEATFHARIIGYMAGAEAEAMLLGATRTGDGDDRYQIGLMAEQLDDGDPLKREARLRAMTRMLVRRHRNRIERVADALLTERTLSAEKIDELTGRSVNDLRGVDMAGRDLGRVFVDADGYVIVDRN